MPMSAYEMESSWSLPVVRHGFLHQILVKRLDFAGRRPGAIASFHGYGKVHPRLTVGAFQASVVTSESAEDRKTDLLVGYPHRSQSLVARAELEGPEFDLGAYYENRIGSPGTLLTDHFWTAGLDLTVDRVFAHGGVRLWADAMAGASWFKNRDKPPDGKDATFVSARALVAYRFGGTEEHDTYIEPFGLLGAFDPDIEVSSDMAWEGAVGLNFGLWKRARLTLQGEINKAQRNFQPAISWGRHRSGGGSSASGSSILMFVVFEGIDGSGKTTVSNQVAEALRARGLSVTHVRENGKFVSAVSEAIRELGRDAKNLELEPQAEFLLYVARDVQLIEQALRPALRKSDVVLADRFLYTAEVLARAGRHLPEEATAPVLQAAANGLEPDLVISGRRRPHACPRKAQIVEAPGARPAPARSKGALGGGATTSTSPGLPRPRRAITRSVAGRRQQRGARATW